MSTVTDPIADLLARLRNGATAQKSEMFVPYSRIKAEVVRILKQEGYITDYVVDTEAAHPRIKITNKLVNRTSAITGQRAAETRAKKSIANFKLRKSQAIGARVTLRGQRMYEFLERLIKAALPRIRDFRGVSPRCFDGRGNYTLGVSDQSIFPEVELDKIKRNIGFDVTIVTTARTNEEAKSLLSEMGMPFSDRARRSAAQPTT